MVAIVAVMVCTAAWTYVIARLGRRWFGLAGTSVSGYGALLLLAAAAGIGVAGVTVEMMDWYTFGALAFILLPGFLVARATAASRLAPEVTL